MNSNNDATFPFMANPFLTWTKMMRESNGRFDGIFDEWERRQKQAVEQVHDSMGEAVKMAQTSLSFSAEVSKEWLKIARGATRWANDVVSN